MDELLDDHAAIFARPPKSLAHDDPRERRAQVARATLESVSALTPQQARQLYDRVGRAQDWQAIYEDRAVRKLTANAEMSSARAVFELGCGTGRLARRLLAQDVPTSCRYVGVDVSPRMVQLTRRRLEPWSQRAAATLVDGSVPLPGLVVAAPQP